MRTYLTAILLFLFIRVNAQYPVQVTPQLLPPYSLQLSDYYSPPAGGGNGKLSLMLLLRDFTRSNLRVRLRMSIESQSFSIRTREDVVLNTFLIEQPGVPLYITPNELASYFNAANLQFSGLTREQYEQSGKLPEGFYTFCFEAVEEKTGQTVSAKACTMAWITLSEPPLLNLPRKAEGVIPATPQYLTFQWTPRHTAAPMAGSIEYVFSLVELDSNAISPEAAFLSRMPLVQATTNLTTLVLGESAATPIGTEFTIGNSATQLIPDKRYAWRVQAKAKSGIEELAMFRNGGYSETYWFTYKNNCAPPIGITATPQGGRVSIEWQDNPVHLEYKVEYRQADVEGAEWFEIGNTLPRVSISDLKPSTQYEYRVGGACEYGRFTFGNLQRFNTNAEGVSTVAQCGLVPDTSGTGSQSPLQSMKPGDTIHAGDFDVMVTNITGQNSLSGEGFVKVSWLADMKVGVRFTNIGVNTEKQLVSGVIETTYDATESGIADVDSTIHQIKEFFDQQSANLVLIEQKLADPQANASELQELVRQLEPGIATALNAIKSMPLSEKEELLQFIADLCTQTLSASIGNTASQLRAIEGSRKISVELRTIQETLEAEAATPARVPEKENYDEPQTDAPEVSITYITPAGTPITLPPGAKPQFRKFHPSVLPDGTLGAFILNGIIYVARIPAGAMSSGGHAFRGYYRVENGKFTEEGYTDASNYATGTIQVRLLLRTKNEDQCGIKVVDASYQLSTDRAIRIPFGSIKTFTQEIESYTVIKTISQQAFASCETDNALSAYLKDNKLQRWLFNKGMDGAVVYLANCQSGKVTLVTSKKQIQLSTSVTNIKERVINKDFDGGDYAIFACLGEDGKWQIETNFRKGVLNPTHAKLKGHEAALEVLVKEQAQQEVAERNAKSSPSGDAASIEQKISSGDGDEFFKASMGMIEAVAAVYDFGKEVINEARMPEGIWNKDGDPDAYANNVYHIPSLLAGAGDQVIDEATEGIQFVQLAYQCVRYPKETAQGLWTYVRKMKWEDVRKMAFERFDNYSQGGTVAKHQGGKDGVRVAMLIFGAWKAAGKTADDMLKKGGDEIEELASKLDFDDEVMSNVDNAIDPLYKDQLLKECYEDPAKKEFLDNNSDALRDAAEATGKKKTWQEVLAYFKRGNDFNDKAKFEGWYQHNEVVIEHPTLLDKNNKPRRFRVDSYTSNMAIVSRKATDLALIQQSTFIKYLDELKNKYPVGAKIVNQDRPGITEILKGKLILEIPKSNESFERLSEYIKIANDRGITLSFKPE